MRTEVLRTFFRCAAAALLLVALLARGAAAQFGIDPAHGPPAAPPPFATGVHVPAMEGPVWIRYNPIGNGLGYQDGYGTVGGLLPVWSAHHDTVYFLQSQAHLSHEGNFFGNLGVGFRLYERSLRRTVGVSFWYDLDDDHPETFGHMFHQFGFSVDSFGDFVDINMNAYCPIGATGRVMGTAAPGFFGNNILLTQGLDLAMHGGDLSTTVRLPVLQVLDLRASIGGYVYSNEHIDPFLGISAGLESHPNEYTTIRGQLNDDEHFGTTGLLSLSLHMGGRRQRAAADRLLEPVQRNDHVVRFHRDPEFLINPLTGAPLRIVHVNNTTEPPGDGTFESPFTSLAQAQLGSTPNDVILVAGTDQAYLGGIVLQDGQRLIGTGLPLVIRGGALTLITAPDVVIAGADPRVLLAQGFSEAQLAAGATVGTVSSDPTTGNPVILDMQFVTLDDLIRPGDILLPTLPGARPTLINPNGPAVTLANNNEVANFRIGDSQVGIFGQGVTGFFLHDNLISNNNRDLATGPAGIRLIDPFGTGRIESNRIVLHNRPNPPPVAGLPFGEGIDIRVGGNNSVGIQLAGNYIVGNDTGVQVISTTTGTVGLDFLDNIINLNVNDGINLFSSGPGHLGVTVRRGPNPFLLDPATGLTPIQNDQALLVPTAQLSGNGAIAKITDSNGNGRGLFADVLGGSFGLLVENVLLDANDSSFFPRYGAIQLNLEPDVFSADATIRSNTITRTGLQIPQSPDAGSGIRIVTNPGPGALHQFGIFGNNITDNLSDAIKLLMTTEGIRTAAIPEGTVVARIQGNTISRNQGIADNNGTVVTVLVNPPPFTTFTYFNTDFSDDFDSADIRPLLFPPQPPVLFNQQGFASNPDPKDEFHTNIVGSGLIVRAKGTDSANLHLEVTDNTFEANVFDALNLAFGGLGQIDYVRAGTGELTPVPAGPVPFGVNARVIIDNNRIAPLADDAVKITMLDGADVAMQITNNEMIAGDAVVATALTITGFPTTDPGFDTAIEIDTWDTSRLMAVIDNNDISGGSWTDGGIELRSHDDSLFVTRVTRNQVLNVTAPFPALNLLAEGNSRMIAFVNNNDLGHYFEATSADFAFLCLQLLDNQAAAGASPQANNTEILTGDAFYLVQTENSVFELEPTRGTNHEDSLPENESITIYTRLLIAPPGAVLPADPQFGNVPTGTCQQRLNGFIGDFPFLPFIPGVTGFEPPVTHP